MTTSNPSTAIYWQFGSRTVDFAAPRVMGILNVTPDSFFAASRQQDIDAALRKAGQFLDEGATFIDVGAYSSRPGADDIAPAEELRRLIPVIEALSKHFPEAILSADTFRAAVAREAVAAGAHLVNDIGGGILDPAMFDTVAGLKVPYILMHMRGTPQTMKTHTGYNDMLTEMDAFFSAQVEALLEKGVKDVCIDVGFGFAKTITQNYTLLRSMHRFQEFGLPLLAGLSRKSMAWKPLGIKADEALNATTVLHTLALQQGASILRVHDVREAVECIRISELYTG
ncbi:dihydropteroate synthase [Pedobacter yulinensis]|uniref:dihydropteroate synthase n=1 Tax=Pedobacter yulinensis TaxID=2126353 RepID=A0A2T3HQ95_9SPHI|nr:dihydropteroate synthase [Pedobacter yulinensis]PST84630.1 dihydropteroate synthase [Pedobacter yulinensis]